ncbi:UNVERIFIED_ORG: hypothetical protein L601_005400000080 [Gordonia westfalica J30]
MSENASQQGFLTRAIELAAEAAIGGNRPALRVMRTAVTSR